MSYHSQHHFITQYISRGGGGVLCINLDRDAHLTRRDDGLKFDIFELMFHEIRVMHIHNSHLVCNFYEQAILNFLFKFYMFYVIFDFITFIPKQ